MFNLTQSGGSRVKRGSVKRRSIKRRSIKRGSVKRGSVKRRSVKRRSIKRGSVKRRSIKRGSVKRRSIKKSSGIKTKMSYLALSRLPSKQIIAYITKDASAKRVTEIKHFIPFVKRHIIKELKTGDQRISYWADPQGKTHSLDVGTLALYKSLKREKKA